MQEIKIKMITEYFFGLVECYSEQGRCLFMGHQLFGYASNLLPLICWGLLTIYVLGVLYNIMRRCLCSCGGFCLDIGSLFCILISLLWPIIIPTEYIFEIVENIRYNMRINKKTHKKKETTFKWRINSLIVGFILENIFILVLGLCGEIKGYWWILILIPLMVWIIELLQYNLGGK
jgi:hypothetical protein